MNGILLTSPRTALGSVLASLATDGFRHGARNHGYGSFNDYALLLRHNRGAFRVGMKHLPKGNTSSLLCLCGISVSLAFYVLYLKFFPRSYHSVILRRVIRRMIQARSQRQTNSILISSTSSSRRRQRTLQQTSTTTSFSVCNESYKNDDNNNNNDNRTIKISDDDTGLSSIGSIDSSKQDGVIFREFHQTSATIPSSSFSSAITPAASSAAAAAADQQQRMRHRITRRRRTHSESLPDVISRLDDFICLIPEIVDRSRHVQLPISRTRNVLDWLAQIDLDPSRTSSLFDEDPLDDAEDAAARWALMKGMQSLESVASAGSGGSSNCGCVYRSRDNWCQDCLMGSRESMAGGRSGRRLDSMEVQLEDEDQGLSVLYPRSTSASSAPLGVALRHGKDNDCSTNHSFVVPVPALGGTEECGGPEVAKVSDEGHDAPKKPFFYFEEEEEDEFFKSTSEKSDLPHPVHFATSTSSGQMDIPGPHLTQRNPLGPTESPSTELPPNSPGGTGYDWLRMRILGVDRKRRISTGSGLSAKFLASRGLLRNHHSFTSAISGTSSEYTYRESLVSKGFSIDCGEDLTDFVIQGEDLLEAAEFSRYTLTNIDQLHEELEFIQRNITYINNKVEFLQTRDDLPTFAARYGYGIEESIENDLCGIMEAAGAFETGMRPRQRSRSLCLMPEDATITSSAVDNTQVLPFKDIEEDLHPGVTTDGFVWDYGSDLALNPTFTHHRSLNGLTAGEVDEDHLSNQLRTRRSRSDEMEYFSLRRGDLAASDDDLCVVKFDDDDDDDDVIEDDPEMTYYSAQLPVRQHTESTCDEYFDDDYDMLTHLHR